MRSPSRRRARLLAASCTVGAVVATAAPPAHATSVVYRDGHDVHVKSVDGTRHRQVTSDGTASAYYTLPSADDAGNVTAIRGSGTSRVIARHPAGGGAPTVNVMPWRVGGGVNAGPTWARVSASGSSLAYGYLYNQDVFTAMRPYLAVVDPRAPGSPTAPAVNIAGYTEGSWFGTKLLATNGQQLFVETTPGTFGAWLVAGAQSITGGDLSRDGRRVLVRFGSGTLELDTLDGRTPPAAAPVSGCQIAPNGTDRYSGLPRMALSADGRRVAWSDAGGVHVATVASTDTPEAACRLTEHVVLSATGGMPSFTEHDLPAPGGGGGGNPGDPGGGGGGGNPGDPGGGGGGGNPGDPGGGGGGNPGDPGGGGGGNPGDPGGGGGGTPGDPGGGGTPGDPGGGGTPGDPGGGPPATGNGKTPGGVTPPGGGTGPDGGGSRPKKGGPAATLRLRTPPRLTAARLRRGQALSTMVPGSGRLTVTIVRAGTTVARGTASAKGAGTVAVRVRLTSSGRRARIGGRSVTVRVSFVPTSGRRQEVRRTVAIGR